MREGRELSHRPPPAALRSGAARAVQAARRQAARRGSAAEGCAGGLAAQAAAVPPRALPGACLLAGGRRHRQPAPSLRVPGDPRGHAHHGPARGLPHRPAQHPAHAHPSAGRGPRQACAGQRDAGIPDLRGQAPQRGDQQGQARAAATGERVSRPLSCGDHHLAAAGKTCADVRDDYPANGTADYGDSFDEVRNFCTSDRARSMRCSKAFRRRDGEMWLRSQRARCASSS